MNPLLMEVVPPFQQLRFRDTQTRSAAVEAGLETISVSSSASVGFECVDQFFAVAVDGVRIFADLIICCGTVTPSEDLLLTLQLRVTQARILQNDGFTIIAISQQRLMMEVMLQRMLKLQRRVVERGSSCGKKCSLSCAAAPHQVMGQLTTDRDRSGSDISLARIRYTRMYSV